MNHETSEKLLVTPCRWADQRQILEEIRRIVFIEEQEVPTELEWDGEDDEAWHFLATLGGVPVGTARLLATGQIGRMSVLQPYRRQGIGTALLQAAEQLARDEHISPLFLHAQTYIRDFYCKQGYEARGDQFMDAGIPHIEMIKRW